MISIKKNFSLKNYNTFGLDQCCSEFIEYDDVAELQSFIKDGNISGKRLFQLGSGSNILLCNDFDGTMMHSQIKGIEIVYEDADFVD
ncbi:MAG: UDP-N-acetylenolpyruvoylglucosamine reductase, partial [Paludibacteraceae bacterium]|nr:UDP-N-acetylenolpyruvoylglucosamine reductase [Paludibacteraceae bacterium]